MGTDFDDGRGNISLALSTATREPSLRVDRDWVLDDFANPDIGGNYFFPIYSGIAQTGTNANYQNVLNSMFPNRPAGTNVSSTGTLYFLGNTPFTLGNDAAGLSGYASVHFAAMETASGVSRTSSGSRVSFPIAAGVA